MRKIILALDNLSYQEIIDLVDELHEKVYFKLNDAFTKFGPQLVKEIQERGGEVFLDLKFFDIPNTMENYMKACADMKVFMINLHCLGGYKMMESSASYLKKYCQANNLRKPLLIGVTVLTSMDDNYLKNDLQIKDKTTNDMVVQLANLSQIAGLDGIVCSPHEIESVKENCGNSFLTVTPGIRPKWSVSEDQVRITTPKEAIEKGTDYMVIGRPITMAKNYGMGRVEAVDKIMSEL